MQSDNATEPYPQAQRIALAMRRGLVACPADPRAHFGAGAWGGQLHLMS